MAFFSVHFMPDSALVKLFRMEFEEMSSEVIAPRYNGFETRAVLSKPKTLKNGYRLKIQSFGTRGPLRQLVSLNKMEMTALLSGLEKDEFKIDSPERELKCSIQTFGNGKFIELLQTTTRKPFITRRIAIPIWFKDELVLSIQNAIDLIELDH